MSSHDDALVWSAERTPPHPARSDVHLWRAKLDVGPRDLVRYHTLLSDDERERADRFHFDIHRHRYVVSRAVLRTLLADYVGSTPREISLLAGEHGKPGLADAGSSLEFNLSHAGGMAVYAFASGRRVGVDVEEESRDVAFLELASRFFSRREQIVLESLQDSEEIRRAFYACWTRKEAYIKALGLGVTHGLSNFAVAFGTGVPASILHSDLDPEAGARWGMRSFSPAPGFAGAIVVEGGDWNLRAFEIPEDHDIGA